MSVSGWPRDETPLLLTLIVITCLRLMVWGRLPISTFRDMVLQKAKRFPRHVSVKLPEVGMALDGLTHPLYPL